MKTYRDFYRLDLRVLVFSVRIVFVWFQSWRGVSWGKIRFGGGGEIMREGRYDQEDIAGCMHQCCHAQLRSSCSSFRLYTSRPSVRILTTCKESYDTWTRRSWVKYLGENLKYYIGESIFTWYNTRHFVWGELSVMSAWQILGCMNTLRLIGTACFKHKCGWTGVGVTWIRMGDRNACMSQLLAPSTYFIGKA